MTKKELEQELMQIREEALSALNYSETKWNESTLNSAKIVGYMEVSMRDILDRVDRIINK